MIETMNFKRRLFYYFLLLNFILVTSCNTDRVRVEMYLTPKDPDYGFYDNGVYQFELNQKSYKESYKDRSYNVITEKDTLHELYYADMYINNKTVRKMFFQKDTDSTFLYQVRGLFLIYQNDKVDSVLVDGYSTVFSKGRFYSLNKELLFNSIDNIPLELYENWMNNLVPKALTPLPGQHYSDFIKAIE